MSGTVGILLAAGAGRRFGAHKLLQALDDGTPVGIAAARALLVALPDSIAVIRGGDRVLRDAFEDIGLAVVENPAADRGMGSSLALGVSERAGAEGWLIALADMPWVRPATIHGLVAGLAAGASIIAPSHAGRRGNPVGFSRAWYEGLAALDGDHGARQLIADHRDALTLFPTGDAGVLADVDHPGDLSAAGS